MIQCFLEQEGLKVMLIGPTVAAGSPGACLYSSSALHSFPGAGDYTLPLFITSLTAERPAAQPAGPAAQRTAYDRGGQ